MAVFRRERHHRPAWIEIDHDALASNIKAVRRVTSPGALVCASVKADAYGHGAVRAAATLLANGADRLCVAMPDEAFELIESGINAPILILGAPEYGRTDEIIANGVAQVICSRGDATELSRAAQRSKAGIDAVAHIKIDTGMGRIGIKCTGDFGEPFASKKNNDAVLAAAREIMEIASMPGLFIEGICTHLASADDKTCSYTLYQLYMFNSLIFEIRRRGLKVPLVHCANSAAIAGFPETHFDMTRPGIALYGGVDTPAPVIRGKLSPKPVMSLLANITFIKKILKHESVGYNRRFIAKRDSTVATLPIGYGDGYPRALSRGVGEVLIAGRRAPIIGNICMDQLMTDITDIPGVNVGDTAILMGTRGSDGIFVQDIASRLGTIPYEVLCMFNSRLPRIHMSGGNPFTTDSRFI